MNINIDTQSLCRARTRLRGIPYYTINLIQALLKRDNNRYSISYFDCDGKNNYRQNMVDYIGKQWVDSIRINECSALDYNDILDAIKAGNKDFFLQKSYAELTGASADVFHFPNPFEIPHNIPSGSVVVVHDCIALMDNIEFNSNSRKLFRAAVGYLEERKDVAVIVDSESVKTDMLAMTNISGDRINVVPLAYDTVIHYHQSSRKVLEGLGIGSPYLLYLGVLDFRKGIVDILNAFEIIRPLFSGLKLVLAGDLNPYVSSIPERLKNYRYIDDVIMTGFVSDEQKRALLSDAEVFLFPSEYEGFGLPVLEAMACGSPVITTNVSSLPEVGGNAAVYVDPKAPEQLAKAIEDILSSPALRSELVKKGYEQIKKFSWDKTAELTEQVYSSVKELK